MYKSLDQKCLKQFKKNKIDSCILPSVYRLCLVPLSYRRNRFTKEKMVVLPNHVPIVNCKNKYPRKMFFDV